MATWTSPTTRAPDYVVDDADWNTDVVENLKFLHDPPRCRVYGTTDQGIPNNSWTPLGFDAERYDSDTMHTTSGNTERITFTTAGTYLLTAGAEFETNGTGIREIRIGTNGATVLAWSTCPSANASSGTKLSVVTVFRFSAADYATVEVFQDSGGALLVEATGAYTPEFSATWIGG